VEYKRGKPKINRCDEVQLCAQALCLEEMLGVGVAEGALFYGKTRRRKAVSFDPELRAITEKASARLHVLIPAGATPKAVYEAKCENCSLVDLCMPRCTEGKKSAKNYLANLLDQAE
jgi:CRISPR-associated exonuclease Cas4